MGSLAGKLGRRQVVRIDAALRGFIEAVENGVLNSASLKRTAENGVTSDFLGLAEEFLDDPKKHPAAAAMVAGATLEEFLRNWVEDTGETPRRGINDLIQQLKALGLVDKQDVKDVTAWAGVRNSADHGEWDKAKDRDQVRLMVQGMGLFIRKHG